VTKGAIVASPEFSSVGPLSITQLCIAFMVMRDGSEAASGMAEQLECWFDIPVNADDVAPSLARMIERKWIQRHPIHPSRLILTDAGEAVAHSAFQGFVRFVDEGNHRWEAGMMWQLARTRLPSKRNS
jgi:hypothetical protein